MHESTPFLDPNDCLCVLEQSPGLFKLFTGLSLCFPVSDASLHSAIVNTLTAGLERLSASFPWIAGQVVNEGASEGISGVFKIIPLEMIPRLVVKDYRDDPLIPTWNTLREANFPFSMLDESIIAPRKTLPTSDEDASEPVQVFLVQANFVNGGLLLTFVGQHQSMDMIGQGLIMDLLSKACRNEPFTPEELSTGNLTRRNLVPLLDDSYEAGPEIAHQIVKPTLPDPVSTNTDGASVPPFSLSISTWAYFTFSPVSLAALKSFAIKTLTLSSGYISTDDTLSAFIWQSVIRARLHRSEPSDKTTFTRAVDQRRYLGISPTYLGALQNMTYNTYTLQKLVDEPLGAIASQLRLAVDPKTSNLSYQTRAMATAMARAPDKDAISVTATTDLGKDVLLSSWAKLDCYELDFNLGLGKPEAVRRPQLILVESLMYFMPKRLDGEITVGLCLRDGDMERLRGDEEFGKYAEYVG
ncbi:MAG: hypothetical protein MMC33_009988 [Icmadophila ericetorum]|nr:hypothetical protein [Icmadophila ericetorum]